MALELRLLPGPETAGALWRLDFETAWRSYLPKCTPADFQAYRDWQAHRIEIDAKHARGEKHWTEYPSSMMTCVCGTRFDSHKPADNGVHLPHIYAAQAAKGIAR
jgi:hypothetical protein